MVKIWILFLNYEFKSNLVLKYRLILFNLDFSLLSLFKVIVMVRCFYTDSYNIDVTCSVGLTISNILRHVNLIFKKYCNIYIYICCPYYACYFKYHVLKRKKARSKSEESIISMLK